MEKRGKVGGKKRYWLRFGIVFAVVAIIVSISKIFFSIGFLEVVLLPTIIIGLLPQLLGINYLGLLAQYPILLVIFAFLLTGIIWFIIGALIGLIYGKIKQRKQNAK